MRLWKWEITVQVNTNPRVHRQLGLGVVRIRDIGDTIFYLDLWKWGVELIVWRFDDEAEED